MRTRVFPWATSLAQRLLFAVVLCIAAGLGRTQWAFLSPVGFVFAIAIMLRGSDVRVRAEGQR